MLECAGSGRVAPGLPSVYVTCSEGAAEGIRISEVSRSRVFIGLWDGHGSVCVRRVEEENDGATEQEVPPAEVRKEDSQ